MEKAGWLGEKAGGALSNECGRMSGGGSMRGVGRGGNPNLVGHPSGGQQFTYTAGPTDRCLR